MNIYQRIAAVQKECGYIKKDTEVGFGNNKYKGTSHDGVLVAVRQHMIDNGIIALVSQQSKGEHYDGKTKSGTDLIRFEAVYDITFICADKPEDRHTVSVEGHGEDYNDKAPGKAISYATKTAFLKTFMIVTGENDEERLEERGQSSSSTSPQSSAQATSGATISEAQGKRLSAICHSSGTPIATVANHFGFKKVGEILKSKYKDICEWAEAEGHTNQMPSDAGDTY